LQHTEKAYQNMNPENSFALRMNLVLFKFSPAPYSIKPDLMPKRNHVTTTRWHFRIDIKRVNLSETGCTKHFE